MDLKELFKIAINASLKGGKEIMEIYSSDFSVESKDDNSPLTLADKNCNLIIEQMLSRTEIPVLSEEGVQMSFAERKCWEFFWLVDPLDGTKEFVKRNGEFTVNIALIHNGTPKLGVVYTPVRKELYFALDEMGSFKKDSFLHPIEDIDDLVAESRSLPICVERDVFTIVGSRSHMSSETEDFFLEKKKEYGEVNILSIGSSLKICMVAEGKADVYPRYAPTMEWDTGAGHAIAKYAGCSVNQYNKTDELVYNKEDLLNPWFLVKRINAKKD